MAQSVKVHCPRYPSNNMVSFWCAQLDAKLIAHIERDDDQAVRLLLDAQPELRDASDDEGAHLCIWHLCVQCDEDVHACVVWYGVV